MTALTGETKPALAAFMKRRRLKETVAELLKQVKEEHQHERPEMTASKSASYDELADSISYGLSRDILPTQSLVAAFDEAELAGRQHVLLFTNTWGQAKTREFLASKTRRPSRARPLSEFWDVPPAKSPLPYLLQAGDSQNPTVVVVMRRTFWEENVLESGDERQLIERTLKSERSAVIIKYSPKGNLIQIRVPPRSSFGEETTKGVYQHAATVIIAIYREDGLEWLNSLAPFPLNMSYPQLIANETDFQMTTDSPENSTFRGVVSSRGERSADLRKLPEWQFKNGYSRTKVRGAWKVYRDGEEVSIDVAKHWDVIRTSSKTQRQIARLFFPGMCSDSEVEHVIRRIQEHL